MSKIIVSACLLGANCKYNGGNNYNPKVEAFIGDREMLIVCPEGWAGLGTPRTPIEIKNGVAVNRDGVVVDEPLRKVVARILRFLKTEDVECAILKARSPTCGVHQIYDGTFTGTLVDGAGVLAQALMDAGYTVLDEEDLEEM